MTKSRAMGKTRLQDYPRYRTLRAAVKFRVAESDRGPPSIHLEYLSGDNLKVFQHTMGFTLRPETTLEQARRLQRTFVET
jgi:hypothetical protein